MNAGTQLTVPVHSVQTSCCGVMPPVSRLRLLISGYPRQLSLQSQVPFNADWGKNSTTKQGLRNLLRDMYTCDPPSPHAARELPFLD